MKKMLLFLILVGNAPLLYAQDFGFGIKAGLSYGKFDGELKEGESYAYKSGFHFGPTFTFRFTHAFSVRTELLYNQLGTQYEFEGPSYFVFYDANDKQVVRAAYKKLKKRIFLNYFDIPVQAAFKLGKTLELFGGANLLILGGATGGGSIDVFNSAGSSTGFTVDMDEGYNTDDPRAGATNEEIAVKFQGSNYSVPSRLGAYYDYTEKKGRTFNTFDLGLHAGLRIFFNEALYLETRFYYGLSDVTNNDMEWEQRREAGADLLELSKDKDTNLSFKISLGFSF